MGASRPGGAHGSSSKCLGDGRAVVLSHGATLCHGGVGNATIPVGHGVIWGTQCPVSKDSGVNHSGKCGEQPFEEE